MILIGMVIGWLNKKGDAYNDNYRRCGPVLSGTQLVCMLLDHIHDSVNDLKRCFKGKQLVNSRPN